MRILKTLAAVIFAAALPCAALAQTSPNLTFGQVLTPGQWNQIFQSKQDALGFTPMNATGGVFLGRVVTAPPGATTAGLNLTPGSTPASPVNGDLWATTLGLFVQINGATVGPLISVATPCTLCGLTTNPLSQFAATTSAQLRGVISDETGTGLSVFNGSPTIVSPTLTGTLTAAAANFSGTVNHTGAFQISGVGQTFPASGLIAGTTDTQTLTNKTLASSTDVIGGVTMTLGSDATGDIYYRNSGGILTRLAIGGSANILTVSGGLPSWAAPTGGGNVSNTGTPTANQIAQWTNATTIQGVNLASLTLAGAGIAISGTTSPTIALSLTNATLQASPANPTGTTSASAVMMGLGSTCHLTPVYSTRVWLKFTGQVSNTSSAATSSYTAKFGTGTAPVNGAAATGTTIGSTIQQFITTGGTASLLDGGGIITGLTVGVAAWFDLQLAASAGTASIGSPSCSAFEL